MQRLDQRIREMRDQMDRMEKMLLSMGAIEPERIVKLRLVSRKQSPSKDHNNKD